MQPAGEKLCQKCLGKMSTTIKKLSGLNRLEERLELVEHWSNQQDILLTGLMNAMYTQSILGKDESI